jgi:hypothetical protein
MRVLMIIQCHFISIYVVVTKCTLDVKLIFYSYVLLMVLKYFSQKKVHIDA